MSERLYPYQLKKPSNYDELLEELSTNQLYLVHKNGPLKFILRDDNLNEFTVYIGNKQKCTCNKYKNNHGQPLLCIHILFVMLKVLRLNDNNPLVWQYSLIDNEINNILQNNERINKINKKKNYLKRGEGHNMKLNNNNNYNNNDEIKINDNYVDRQPIEDDDICPICQDDMLINDALTYCKIGCGNNLHIKCAKMYVDHRMSNNKEITCPLCRCDWIDVVNDLKNDINNYKNKKKEEKKYGELIPIKCIKCGVNILSNYYRCIKCGLYNNEKSYDLCRRCFNNTNTNYSDILSNDNENINNINHLSTHPFVMGKALHPEIPYKPAFRQNQPLIPRSVLTAMEYRELTNDDINLFQLIESERNAPLHIFLLNSFLISTNNISNIDNKCCFCNEDLILDSKLRILPCKTNDNILSHNCHESCLSSFLLESFSNNNLDDIKCPIHNISLFPHLERKYKKKKKKKKKKITKEDILKPYKNNENKVNNNHFDFLTVSSVNNNNNNNNNNEIEIKTRNNNLINNNGLLRSKSPILSPKRKNNYIDNNRRFSAPSSLFLENDENINNNINNNNNINLNIIPKNSHPATIRHLREQRKLKKTMNIRNKNLERRKKHLESKNKINSFERNFETNGLNVLSVTNLSNNKNVNNNNNNNNINNNRKKKKKKKVFKGRTFSRMIQNNNNNNNINNNNNSDNSNSRNHSFNSETLDSNTLIIDSIS